MKRRVNVLIKAVLGVCVLAGTPSSVVAQAAAPSAADARFEEGLALLRAGRFAEACPKLEESVRLDPAPGAKFRLGECYEGLGRYTAAYRMYREVEADTRVEKTVEREQQVRAKLEEVEKRVAWLVVRSPESVRTLEGFGISLDGVELSAEDLRATRVPLDVGVHTVRAHASGHAPIEQVLTAAVDAPVTFEVPPLVRLPDVPTPPISSEPPGEPSPGSGAGAAGLTAGRLVGLVFFGASAAALAPGIALGVVALDDWDDAVARCADGSRTQCPDDAIADGDAAYGLAVGSTALFIGAGALASTGLVLWLASSSEVPEVSVRPSERGTGAIITVRGATF